MTSYNDSMEDIFGIARKSLNFFKNLDPSTEYPLINMYETEDGTTVRVVAEIVGISKSDLDVHMNDNVLTISFSKELTSCEEFQTILVDELRYGKFQRHVKLPFTSDNVIAKYENGLLVVTIVRQAPAAMKVNIS